MALPKRRHSKTRRDKRRGQDKIAKPSLTRCSNCGAAILPHHICKKCGYYKGVHVVVKKEKKKKKR